MERTPRWLARVAIIGLLSWAVWETHENGRDISAIQADIQGVKERIDFLVRFIVPSGKRVEARECSNC